MSSYSKSSKGLLSFKLKTIPLIILTTFSQHGQAEENSVKNNASTSLAQPSVDDANEIGSVNVVRPMVLPSSAAKYDKSGSILLSAKADDDNAVGTSAGAKEYARSLADDKGKNDLPIGIELQDIQVRAKRLYEIGPLRGLALTKEEIPGNVQSISAKEIKESRALSISDLMNSKLQSVNVNDYQSNPFQMDVTYRGFTASPQLGTAQGLSVFLDGIRVNEPFGDVVNWDMLPLNALAGLDVFPGSNPLFGLGTLGGALSMRTKSGFDAKEGTIEVLGGSFNRKQIQGSVSGNNGVIAGFMAANLFNEDGWRDNSPSKVNQIFAKGEWRNDKVQVGLSALYAGNKLVGNGMLPTELAQQDRSQVFTSPDETNNRLMQFQLTGLWDVTDTFNITGQIYKRKSRRNSSTGDINQDFSGGATRRPNPGELITSYTPDMNGDGLPDIDSNSGIIYNNVASIMVPVVNGNPIPAVLDVNGNPEYFGVDINGDVLFNSAFDSTQLAYGTNGNTPYAFSTPPAYAQGTETFTDANGNSVVRPLWSMDYYNAPPTSAPAFSSAYYQQALNAWNNRTTKSSQVEFGLGQYFDPNSATYSYLDTNGFLAGGSAVITDVKDANGNYIVSTFPGVNYGLGKPLGILVRDPVTGVPIQRNGADCVDGPNTVRGKCSGYVSGTPTALITETEIDQLTDGGAIQFNWNLEKHKFMVGMSIDSSNAGYKSGQYLGLLDEKRNAYLDPTNVGYEFAAASTKLGLNDFSGNSITKSLYFSETWTPVKEWNFTGAARYNQTHIRNELAINNYLGLTGPMSFKNFLQPVVTCNDLNGNGILEPEQECPATEIMPFTIARAEGLGAIGKGEVEKFSYYSLNPSLGATWQPTETFNAYANWSKGSRTPSVIELGCALDDTQVPIQYAADGVTPIRFASRSLAQRRFCSLPSTLSGDPYLKQVRSETMEIGARGYITPDIQWNASLYNTDLTDDIYFVSFTPERSFFQTIGNTRRRGLEMGLQGKLGKMGFRVNYSLTDATFQDSFNMASPNNSSAGNVIQGDSILAVQTGYQQIRVNPGNRMPGVPLHNLNATLSYDLTTDWTVGLTAILHSGSFIRGNENNKHRAGASNTIYSCGVGVATNDGGIQYGNSSCGSSITRPNYRYPGSVPGYAVFNFNTAYKITKGLTAGLQITNLFNREYYTAGRLGVNPFSPSVNGAIGPGGFNYNSNDWLSSTFLAPGAPRAGYLSLTYDFDVGK